MRTRLALLLGVVLLLGACSQQGSDSAPTAGAATPTTSAAPIPTPNTGTTTVDGGGLTTTGCGGEGPFAVLCETVDLIHDHYVDPRPDRVLALAADRGVEEFATPGSQEGPLTCALPSEQFLAVCEEIDRIDVSPVAGAEAAVMGITRFALDPNSVYFDPAALALVEEEQSGSVEGIGALVSSRDLTASDPETTQCELISEDCILVVVSILPDSPAESSGLREGDVMVSVDGEDIDGWTLDEVTGKVRGAAGTDVTIGVRRSGETSEITITRAEIDIPVVQTDVVGDAGYLRLNIFTDNADEAVRRALQDLLDAGIDRLVLDLRNNPGGALTAAVNIASEFLGDGVVLRTEAPEDETTYQVEEGGLLTDTGIPVIVVVNAGSASASEVVAAALQEAHRAVVVGARTYGKNTVQQRFPLSNGGAIKLTIARWVTGDGTDFGDGISPDAEGEFDNGMSPETVVAQALELAATA